MIGWLLVFACGGNSTCLEQDWFADADGDGHGDPFRGTAACEAPEDHVGDATDCDDADPDQHPGALWHPDADGDGFGAAGVSIETCARPLGYVADDSDCDDTDPTRYPGGTWFVDADADGHGDPDQAVDACTESDGASPDATDCDDDDPGIHPSADEICDGLDNDCDGETDDDDPDVDPYTRLPLYVDADNDGWGEVTLAGRGCTGGSGYSLQTGDCDDTDPTVHPERREYADDVDSDCDGEPWYQGVQDSWIGWSGAVDDAELGRALTASDVDADGLPDLLLGLTIYGDEAGAVTWASSTWDADGGVLPEDTPLWTGEVADDEAGTALDWALDADGQVWAWIGAPGVNENAGVVYRMAQDAPSGSLAGAEVLWRSLDETSVFGEAVLGLGDLDGDGLAEVLVSGSKHDEIDNNRGAIWLLTGAAQTPGEHDPAEAWRLDGGDKNDQFGHVLAHAGDRDGDGLSEVLIGAPYADDVENAAGEVLVVPVQDLADGSVDLTSVEIWRGVLDADHVGFAVVGLGDEDGDGYDDMLVGPGDSQDNGAAWLVRGRPDADGVHWITEADAMFVGQEADDNTLGEDLAGPGDLDGDGYADLVIASRSAEGRSTVSDEETNNCGRVYVVPGGGLSGTWYLGQDAPLQIQGDEAGAHLGEAMAAAGDVDGDGLDDLWLGAGGWGSDLGRTYLLTGAEGL